MGGVELLYPILEQVHLPIRKRAESLDATSEKSKLASSEEDQCPLTSPPPMKESPTSTLDVAWWFDGELQYHVHVHVQHVHVHVHVALK